MFTIDPAILLVVILIGIMFGAMGLAKKGEY